MDDRPSQHFCINVCKHRECCWRNAASAALQPHLTQQMQRVPAGRPLRANFMLAWVDAPFPASKEMSKSHLCSKGVSGEEHYFCTMKGMVVLPLLL